MDADTLPNLRFEMPQKYDETPESWKEECQIKQWCQKWSDKDINQFVRNLLDKGLNRHEIAIVTGVLDKTCHRCFDAPTGCQCENDE